MSSDNEIAKATEIVSSIPDFVRAVAEVVQTPSGFVVATIVLIWLIVNRDFTKFFFLFEYKKNRRLEKLERYASDPDKASKDLLEVVKEQRDTYYFKEATSGIYAEKNLRKELIKLHEVTGYHVNWTTIRRAMPYIKLSESGVLYVKKKNFIDVVGVYYNRVVAILLGLVFIGTTLLLIFTISPTFSTILKMMSIIVFSGLGILFILAQNFPVSASKKIEKEIEKIKDIQKD